jgi:hypothetical protein
LLDVSDWLHHLQGRGTRDLAREDPVARLSH